MSLILPVIFPTFCVSALCPPAYPVPTIPTAKCGLPSASLPSCCCPPLSFSLALSPPPFPLSTSPLPLARPRRRLVGPVRPGAPPGCRVFLSRHSASPIYSLISPSRPPVPIAFRRAIPIASHLPPPNQPPPLSHIHHTKERKTEREGGG